jgi:hypothetical protein
VVIISYLTDTALKKPDSKKQNLASEEGDEKPRKITIRPLQLLISIFTSA